MRGCAEIIAPLGGYVIQLRNRSASYVATRLSRNWLFGSSSAIRYAENLTVTKMFPP